jgi:hypothetical protein
MGFFKRMIDFFTLGSDRPVRRLVAYYLVLAGVAAAAMYFFPIVDHVLGSAQLDAAPTLSSDSRVLQDGLAPETIRGFDTDLSPRATLALSTLIIMLGVLVLMLPVSWVYMSTRYNKGHNQQVAQTLIYLPLVVAGIVLVVQNSLALGFALAGVVAAVRFRTTLRDARDVVFIFLAIAIAFAAGVQMLIVGAVVSVLFNFVLILSWRYDFGRNVLDPSAAAQWAEPLEELAQGGGPEKVPDRDLVLALDTKKAEVLADRFDRVRKILGRNGKKPRFNAVVSVVAEDVNLAQPKVEAALEDSVSRWRLDEAITNVGKPSELFYLVRIRKSSSRDEVMTALRGAAGDVVNDIQVELAPALVEDHAGR